jgi:electron transfer flavoprotein beta subunit
MMNTIFACYKQVLDERDIRVEGTAVDMSRASQKISDYDLNVIEAAAQIAQMIPESKTVGLTVGGPQTKSSFKEALSRGLDSIQHVNSGDTALDDHRITAKALAGAIQQDDEASLAICAEGSQDLFSRQTAPRLAALLDWPVITSVVTLTFESGQLQATRKLEDCLETVTVALPAVVAVLPAINAPEFPKLKAIMAASKKPSFESKLPDTNLDSCGEIRSQVDEGYVMNRKNIVLKDGSIEDRVTSLIDYLRKDGVL